MIIPLLMKAARVARRGPRIPGASSLLFPLALALAVTPLTGCSDDDSPVAPIQGDARVRVLHLSPDAPGVDVYLNDSLPTALTRLEFPNGTGYLEVDPGTYDVAVTVHGSPVEDAVLRASGLNLAPETFYTAVALGPVAEIQLIALEDDYAGIPEGFIRVRAIHAAVGVGQVDIWNIPATGAPTPLYQNVDFGVAGQFLDLPAAAYTLGFDVDDDAAPDVFFNLPALAAGTLANVFAVTDGDANLSLRAQLPNGALASVTPGDGPAPATAELRAIHLSPDAPAVDAFLNGDGTPVATGLGFAAGTPYLSVEAGNITLDVAPTGSGLGGSALNVSGLPLTAGLRYTAAVFGSVNALQALPLVDDATALAPGDLRVRAIHTANGVGEVDIWNIPAEGSPARIVENLGYGQAGGTLDLPAGAYTLGIDADDDAVPDFVFSLPPLPAGTVANVFAVLDGNDALFLLAQFADGTTARIDPSAANLRALHLSPGTGSVDVFVNGGNDAALRGLTFGQGSGFASVPSGALSLDVSPAGTSRLNSVLGVSGLTIPEGSAVTAVAYGPSDDIRALALTEEFGGLGAGNIRVRAIHTASAVGQVDIWNVPATGDPTPLYTNVDYGVAGAYADLPAGAYTLGFDVNDDLRPDLYFELPALAAGTVANVFAVNDAQGNVFLAAQLADGAVIRVQPATARARVIHLSPDTPGVDAFFGGSRFASAQNIRFGAGSAYATLTAGVTSLDVAPANKGLGASVLQVNGLSFGPGQSYTAVAYNEFSALTPLALEDDYAGLDAGNIRVRAIHTAAGVGQVDIWNVPDTGAPSPLFTDVDFGEATSTLDIPVGAYTLGFDVDNDAAVDLFFPLPALAAGTVANVFAVRDADGAVFLAAQPETGPVLRVNAATAELRVAHFSPDAPAVDVFLNGNATPAVKGLAFPLETQFLTVPAGATRIDVAVAGDPIGASLLTVAGVALAPGGTYTAVAFDEAAQLEALALDEDFSAVPAGNIRVRAVHTAVGVGEVDIWNVPMNAAPAPLYTDVPFGVAGNFLELPAGAYRIGFDVDNDASPDVLFQLPSLPAGTVATFYAVTGNGSLFLKGSYNNRYPERIEPTSLATAQVRTLHLSSDAPAVDIYSDRGASPAVSGLAFTEGSGFASLEAGRATFDVVPAGSPLSASVLTVAGVELRSHASYTVVAFNTLGSIQALALEEELHPVANRLRVRAGHTAPGVGQVDIYSVPAQGPATLLFSNLDFGKVSAYRELAPGAYRLGIDVDNDASADLRFTLPALNGGTIANVFAVLDDEGVFLLAQFADGSTARIPADPPETTAVNILHLSPNAPLVDIYLDGAETPAYQDLDFLEGTGFLELPAKTYRVDVSPANSSLGASVLTVDALALEADVTYTAVAYDVVENISALPLVNDFSPVAPGQIRVRAIHTAAALGQVDIWNIPATGDPAPLYPDLDFGEVGAYLTLPAAAYTLGVDVDDDAVPDVTFSLPALSEGTVAEVFAVTDEAGTPFLRVLFADGSLATIHIDPTP